MDFMWSNRIPKISYNKLIQSHEKLGLKLVDLQTKDLALKASWPVRWIDRESSEMEWFTRIFE